MVQHASRLRAVLLVISCLSLVSAADDDAVTEPLVADADDAAVPVMSLDLPMALAMARNQGRAFARQVDELALVRYELEAVQAGYRPLADAAIGGGLSGSEGSEDTLEADAEAGVSQRLPGGGRVRVGAEANASQATSGDSETVGGRAEIELRQPLLRGFGSEPWREQLTDAERAWLYAQRSHELFLQDLTLEIAGDFWRLQELRFSIIQNQASLDRSRYILRQAEAFREVGKSTLNDVLRAEINLMTAEQDLLDAEAIYEVELDRFKTELGLAVTDPVEIEVAEAQVDLLPVDAGIAITLAQAQRLDLLTASDRVADAERAVRLARNDMRPDLDVTATLGYGASGRDRFNDVVDDARADYRVAVRLTLPLDRRNERLAYQQAMVALSDSRRRFADRRDDVVEGVRRALRDLRRAEASLRIQERTVEQSQRRLRKSLMDFEAGLISNRDLVEAQGELRDAETAVFRARIAYRESELRLRRETGVLAVDDQGRWQDGRLPYHRAEQEDSEP